MLFLRENRQKSIKGAREPVQHVVNTAWRRREVVTQLSESKTNNYRRMTLMWEQMRIYA